MTLVIVHVNIAVVWFNGICITLFSVWNQTNLNVMDIKLSLPHFTLIKDKPASATFKRLNALLTLKTMFKIKIRRAEPTRK